MTDCAAKSIHARIRGEVLQHARGPVGVVRVYESADTPHVVLDGAGIPGAALELEAPTDEGRRRWIGLSALAAEVIQPVIAATAQIEALALRSANAYGRSAGIQAWDQPG